MNLEPNKSQSRSYRDSRCSEYKRNIDKMIFEYNEERKNVIDELMNDSNRFIEKLWKNESPISIDNNCLCQMGNNKHLNQKIRSKKYSCPQCKTLGRLVDLELTTNSEPFQFECGSTVEGRTFQINRIRVPNVYIQNISLPHTHSYLFTQNVCQNLCSQPINGKRKDQYPRKNHHYGCEKYIDSDLFTNNFLITEYLQDFSEFSEDPDTPIQRLLISFVCNSYGYNIYEYQDIGSYDDLINRSEYLEMEKIPIEVATGIVLQLLSGLKMLSSYRFVHGNPSNQFFSFSSVPINYLHDNVKIESPISLRFSSFETSSIDLKIHSEFFPTPENSNSQNLRLISSDPIILDFLSQKHFFPEITMLGGNEYTLTSESYDLVKMLRRIGIPILGSSLDVYILFFSLMKNSKFSQTVIEDPFLNSLWSELSINISGQILNRPLKCNILDILWEKCQLISS